VTWLKTDDKMPRHPKVQPLSDAAFRLHHHALSHCAEHETDGFVATSAIDSLTHHKDKGPLIHELLNARGFRSDAQPLWSEVDGGWRVHDFLEYNPSHAELEAKRRRAKERLNVTRELREYVVLRDGFVCGICGSPVDPSDVHIDHITPVSRGGSHLATNLQVAHSKCNLRKGAR